MKLHKIKMETNKEKHIHLSDCVVVVDDDLFHFCYLALFFFFLSKDEDISVVFGAKSLRNYTGQYFSNVSIHKKDYDR